MKGSFQNLGKFCLESCQWHLIAAGNPHSMKCSEKEKSRTKSVRSGKTVGTRERRKAQQDFNPTTAKLGLFVSSELRGTFESDYFVLENTGTFNIS